jgi:Concanavalin A-like lectin/glucanases superfamily
MDTQMYALHFASTLILLLGLLWTPACAQSRVDRSAPTAQGLVGWWRVLPGLSGAPLWYDLMGRFPATLTNMTTTGSGWAPTTRPGGQGEVRFDGVNDYCATATSIALYPAQFSLLAWVKRTATGLDYQLMIGNGGTLREFRVRSTGALAWYFTGTSYGYDHPAGNALIPLNTWTHVAWTYSSGGSALGRAYINCVEDFTDSGGGAGGPFSSNQPVVFGAASSGTTDRFSGVMDDVRVYNRVLAPAELCTVMRQSQRGDLQLLPPPTLLGFLAQGLRTPSAFFPFFSP